MFMTGRASWPTLAKSPTVSELRFLLGKMERLHGDGDDGVPCLLSGDATSPHGPSKSGRAGSSSEPLLQPAGQGFLGMYFHARNNGHRWHETLASEQMVTEGHVITRSWCWPESLVLPESRVQPWVPPLGVLSCPLCSSITRNWTASWDPHSVRRLTSAQRKKMGTSPFTLPNEQNRIFAPRYHPLF